jgi:hypothetical protein
LSFEEPSCSRDIRVSRPRQGRSGLGLEAQPAAIAQFANQYRYRIAKTFSELETGKGAVRSSVSPGLRLRSRAQERQSEGGRHQ